MALYASAFVYLGLMSTLWVVVTLCIVVFGGFLALSVRRMRRMDVP